jgi:CelD/BcsL family acetyltransferase involved in cellulose biosynthesis
VFKGTKGISAIYNQWIELARQSKATHLMQQPDYYLSYAERIAPAPDAIFVAAFFDSLELLAIVPLRFNKRSKLGITIGCLEFPKTPIPIKGLVVQDHVNFNTLVSCLEKQFTAVYGKQWDLLKLEGITTPVSDYITAFEKSKIIIATISQNNYIHLTGGNYVQESLSTKMRSNLRRRMKKLASIGSFAFKTVSRRPELYDAYDAFLETEAAGWKSRRGGRRAIKLHQNQRAFYRDLLDRYSKDGRCHIHLLEVNGRAIASDYCLLAGHSAFSLKHGFDEAYSAVSPSQLLREYTINYYSSRDDIQIIDFISDYAWQDQWRPEKRNVLSVMAFNRTVRARLLQAYVKINLLIGAQKRWYG